MRLRARQHAVAVMGNAMGCMRAVGLWGAARPRYAGTRATVAAREQSAMAPHGVQQHQRRPYLVVVVHCDRHDGGACLAMSVEEHIGLTLRQTLTADQVEGGVGGGRRGRGGGEEGAAVGDGRPQSPACEGMA